MLRINRDHKMTGKAKRTTLKNINILPKLFDNFRTKSLKVSGRMKRFIAGLAKLCPDVMIAGKRSTGKTKQRWSGRH